MKNGNKIRDARIRAGMTQAELCVRARLTQSALSNLEQGRIKLGATRARRLAKALNIPIGDLL